jgi:competence protein ComFC
MWRQAGNAILDLLYPPACAVCGLSLKNGRGLCDDCDADLPRLAAPLCQSCGEPFMGRVDAAASCPRCLEEQPVYDFARPVLRRSQQALELIHRFKYLREIHLARDLGRIAAEAFGDPRLGEALRERWPLVPVPLHRSRLRKRHFNQAVELARLIARQHGLAVLPALKRVRATGSQTQLTREQRRKNLSGAFELTQRGRRWVEQDQPVGVVLVDDVLTTGATAEACARVLHKAGVEEVAVVSLMRG